MSSVAEHINYQSKFLFEIPERLNIIHFVARSLTLWYSKKLDLMRAEILGLVSMIRNEEIQVDSKSHFIFQKLFGMLYRFEKTLEKDTNPALYTLKLSVSRLCDSLKELLSIHEQLLLADHNLPIDSAESDFSDWTTEKKSAV